MVAFTGPAGCIFEFLPDSSKVLLQSARGLCHAPMGIIHSEGVLVRSDWWIRELRFPCMLCLSWSRRRSWDTSTFRRKDWKQRWLGLCRERKAATESAQTHPTPRYVDHARTEAALILIAEANFRTRKTDWVELNADTLELGIQSDWKHRAGRASNLVKEEKKSRLVPRWREESYTASRQSFPDGPRG